MMFRAALALAAVALARGANHAATVGASKYSVDMQSGEYLVDDKPVAVGDGVDVKADSPNQKSATIGSSLGKKLATAEIAYKIDAIEAATKALLAENVALAKDKAAAEDATKNGPQTIAALNKELESVAVKPATINGITNCASESCTTTGLEQFVVLLDGEIYADVEGLVKCELTIDGKAYHTAGLGKTTGVSGRHSAVVCDAGPLPPAAVNKKTITAAVSVKVGSQSTLKVSAGKKAELKLFASGAALHPDQDVGPFMFKAAHLDAAGTYTMDMLVVDPDTSFKDVTAAFTGAEKVMDKVELVHIKDVSVNGDGAYHLGVKFTPKKLAGAQHFMLKVSFRDSKNLASNTVELDVTYVGAYALLMKLSTSTGGHARTWMDTTWWEKSGEVNADHAGDGDWEKFTDDIKTSTYDEPIGPRLIVYHLDKTTKIGTSTYDISKAYQGKSLRELVSSATYNDKNIGNKVTSKSNGKIKGNPKYWDKHNRDGNCRPRQGDYFVDTNNPLRVRSKNAHNEQDGYIRLSTQYKGCRGGHIFGGIGGRHKHGSWTIAYEAMPVVGYCTTWNGYGKKGSNYDYPQGGNNPYRNCIGNGGGGNDTPVDIAIYKPAL